jgi:hypothetical protein
MPADIRSFFGGKGATPLPKQEKSSGKENDVSADFISLLGGTVISSELHGCYISSDHAWDSIYRSA